MKNKKLALFLLIVITTLIACSSNTREIKITKVSKLGKITLKCSDNNFDINHIELRIVGYTSSDIIIQKMHGSNVITTYKIESGYFNKDLSGDWYSDECILDLNPLLTDSVNLNIKYKFR